MKLLKNYKDLYINDAKAIKKLNQKTIKAYHIDLTQFYHYINQKEIDKYILHDYIVHLHQSYKPKTVKRKIASLHAFFTFLEDEEYITDNPLKKVKWKFKEPTVLPKTIPIPVINKLIQTMKADLDHADTDSSRKIIFRDFTLLQLLFSTGLRVSEISNLKQRDVHVLSSNILIFGKGSKERFLQIEDSVKTYLVTYTNLYQKELIDTEYFFVNRLGNRLSDQSIRNMIGKYCKKAQIDMHITPHMFRHTFATLLLEEDVDIRYIQHILGHSSITTTQIYTHVTSNKQKEILLHKNPIQRLHIS